MAQGAEIEEELMDDLQRNTGRIRAKKRGKGKQDTSKKAWKGQTVGGMSRIRAGQKCMVLDKSDKYVLNAHTNSGEYVQDTRWAKEHGSGQK